MPDGDRTAVHIENVLRNPEAITTIDHLHGKSLVQFPHVDVADLEILPLQKLGNCEPGTDAPLIRLASSHGETAEYQAVRNPQLVRALARHQQRRRCAVGKLGRVARGNRAFTDLGIEVRFQSQQTFEGRIRTIAFIAIATDILSAGLVSGFLLL